MKVGDGASVISWCARRAGNSWSWKWNTENRSAAPGQSGGVDATADSAHSRSIVVNRVDWRIRLFCQAHGALVRSTVTGRVYAVSKENNSFSTGNGLQLFLEYVFDGVVETRPAAGARATNRFRNHLAIGRRFTLHLDSI